MTIQPQFSKTNSEKLKIIRGDKMTTITKTTYELHVNFGGNLGFWNDFNGHLLSLQLSFLHLSNTSISKMPSPNLISNFIFISEMFGESKILVEPRYRLRLRYGSLVGFHGPVPPRQRRPYVFRRRGRQKRSLEEAARRDGEHVAARTRTVKWEERRSLTVVDLLRVFALAIGAVQVRFSAVTVSDCDGYVLRR